MYIYIYKMNIYMYNIYIYTRIYAAGRPAGPARPGRPAGRRAAGGGGGFLILKSTGNTIVRWTSGALYSLSGLCEVCRGFLVSLSGVSPPQCIPPPGPHGGGAPSAGDPPPAPRQAAPSTSDSFMGGPSVGEHLH